MSYGLETAGGVLGGLVGGVGGAAKGAVTYGAGGALAGGAVGAATGGTLGLATGPGEVLTLPAGAAGGAIVGGAAGGIYGGVTGAVAGVPGGVSAGQQAGKWLSDKIDEWTGANTKADAKPAEKTDTGCVTCGCAALAGGVPGSKYRGGAHSAMAQPSGDGLDSHHTPAKAASPLPPGIGPAIQMDQADHRLTASNGTQPGYKQYIAAQAGLVNSGNFTGATAMDIADIHAKFGNKYDGAIAQMLAYTACLKRTGVIK